MSMDHKLTILTGKFSLEEEYLILRKYPSKLEDLQFFREANYFQIHKLYFRGFFQGYVVLFLGHHSLESGDVLIEDIGYLRDEEFLEPLIYMMLLRIKEHKVMSFPIDDIYYDMEKVEAKYEPIFQSLGFLEDQKELCRVSL